MQSQTFFLQNDTLCQFGLQWIQEKLWKFELFNFFRKRGRPLAVLKVEVSVLIVRGMVEQSQIWTRMSVD
jgi:uncharacterized protein YqgQ